VSRQNQNLQRICAGLDQCFLVSEKSPDKAVQYRTDAKMLYKKNPSWEDAKRLNDKTVRKYRSFELKK
jgi:hypothetical protein